MTNGDQHTHNSKQKQIRQQYSATHHRTGMRAAWRSGPNQQDTCEQIAQNNSHRVLATHMIGFCDGFIARSICKASRSDAAGKAFTHDAEQSFEFVELERAGESAGREAKAVGRLGNRSANMPSGEWREQKQLIQQRCKQEKKPTKPERSVNTKTNLRRRYGGQNSNHDIL